MKAARVRRTPDQSPGQAPESSLFNSSGLRLEFIPMEIGAGVAVWIKEIFLKLTALCRTPAEG
jgi:hypothetical protein